MSARILGASVARFRSNPLAGRTAPAVTATWDEGRGRLTSGPFTQDVDLPRVVGGRNEAPSPTLYLLGALAGCAGAVIHDTLAPQLGVRVTGVSAVARCRSDLVGMLGVNGADPHLTGFAIEIAIESPESRERIETLRHAWSQRCPIYLSLLNPIAVDITWTQLIRASLRLRAAVETEVLAALVVTEVAGKALTGKLDEFADGQQVQRHRASWAGSGEQPTVRAEVKRRRQLRHDRAA